mmetsp:Transcript_68836/g.164229  ORF Transcript_68836/g.164229 Transcript_68836/m.164229 type:complete len:254 (-) Transcript_68836:64-825(-)|eukprot:CAMPEP_0180120522 /NCGR_PEP_ID=MMETSP0986-20121125/2569_1 /TAXON_ID=697907 /ORGANISM="non described non described, Strain CCMP2293" /LENGTH=253 /DNA_ID=CAMNT_0022059613 /DNA_START=172 /DNA_END=933 /DNA_ORIENTATION=-
MSGEGENGEEENDAKKKKNAEEDAPVVVPSIMDRAGTGSTPLMERYDHKSQDYSHGVEEYNAIPEYNDWPIQALNPSLQSTNPLVFLDISLTSVSLGKLIIQLFSHTVPKTAENFRQLCMGDPSKGELTFKNCRFHSIVAEVMMSSGDITHGDGTGGMSIYGPSFADESLQLKHVGPGIVTMVNTGRDSNNSQFAVTLGRAEWLDGTCVVVGKVVEGLPLLNMVAQRYGSASGLPKQEVFVGDCGSTTTYSSQ